MDKVYALMLGLGGEVTPVSTGDVHELLSGEVDVFSCPDRVHVGFVGEWSAFDPHRSYNHLAWCLYGRSQLYGPAIVKRDDGRPLDEAFVGMVEKIAELIRAGDNTGAIAAASEFWGVRNG